MNENFEEGQPTKYELNETAVMRPVWGYKDAKTQTWLAWLAEYRDRKGRARDIIADKESFCG